MTAVLSAPTTPGTERTARPRRFLMCAPTYFAVSYAINPWMDVTRPADPALATQQWNTLRSIYRELGHQVQTIPAEPGLPDMVFAANGGLVIDGRAYGARFTHPQRQPEGAAYLRWLDGAGLVDATAAVHTNEGEGDFLLVGDSILAGTGFRTAPQAHAEVQQLFGRKVISLTLVDPRFYHLDTALAVLDEHQIAYFPGAFDDASQQVLRRLYPDAIIATAADAEVLGLNAVSDGRNVVLSDQAVGMKQQLESKGYHVIGVDLSELLKAGGGAKCCTLELRTLELRP